MIYVIIAISVLVLLITGVSLYILKFKRENNSEDMYFISKDRVDMIKEKYKALEKIKKLKKVTKEDVENFYRSQKDDN